MLDADIRSFFDTISHDWLIRFLEHRIRDRRIVRLIGKWLTAGVLEEGRWIETEEGTPQGAVISPFLGNVYLHYVYVVGCGAFRLDFDGGSGGEAAETALFLPVAVLCLSAPTSPCHHSPRLRAHQHAVVYPAKFPQLS